MLADDKLEIQLLEIPDSVKDLLVQKISQIRSKETKEFQVDLSSRLTVKPGYHCQHENIKEVLELF